LRTWSGLDSRVTVDVALVWIDPAIVSPVINGLGSVPSGINTNPVQGQTVHLYASDGTGSRTTTIRELDYTIPMEIAAWQGKVIYSGQIRTAEEISQPGDSGAMVFDDQHRIVGMVVGGAGRVGDIITPIGAILGYAGWNGVPSLVTATPRNFSAPPAQADVAAGAIKAGTQLLAGTAGSGSLAAAVCEDGKYIPDLISQGSTADGLATARRTAAAALTGYPHNGCAAHLSALLRQASIDVSMTLSAGMLAHRFEQRGWTRIAVHQQQAGDVGVCFDNTDPPGADHIYLVVRRIDDDLMDIADNQNPVDEPHRRYASGKGKTATQYFLRAI